jgi:hypothetical protein
VRRSSCLALLSSSGSPVDTFSGANDRYGNELVFNEKNNPVFGLSTKVIRTLSPQCSKERFAFSERILFDFGKMVKNDLILNGMRQFLQVSFRRGGEFQREHFTRIPSVIRQEK